MRVLVAPDSFKGTYSAQDVASLIATGLQGAGAEPVIAPLADGGEGTLDVLRGAVGGELRTVTVTGPLGDLIQSQFLVSADGRTAVVETASASGLTLVPSRARDPWAASTRGTGEMVAAAAATRPERILLGVGGSATTDGGAGAIDGIEAGGGLRGCQLEILCDVTTPYEDAARVYGPQKGADADMVRRLEQRLHGCAERLPRDPRGVEHGGAAGGLAGGLWAQYGATLRPGIQSVLEAVGFAEHLSSVSAVISGEGRLDAQTSAGKVIAGVLGACASDGRALPVHAVVGQTSLAEAQWRELGLASVTTASTRRKLVEAGRRLGAAVVPRS